MIASVQRRYFSDKFRNFVDLCVQRRGDLRPNANELLSHTYLKKMKLPTCLSTFQMSIIADGLLDLQLKCRKQQLNGSSSLSQTNLGEINAKTNSTSTPTSNNGVMWNF